MNTLFQKRHYEAVARIINQRLNIVNRSATPNNILRDKLKFMADEMSMLFAMDNGKFKQDVFMKACGF